MSSACKVVVRHVASFADPTNTKQFSFFFLEDLRLGYSNEKYIHIPNTRLNHSVLEHWRKIERERERRGFFLATVGQRVVSYWPDMQCE